MQNFFNRTTKILIVLRGCAAWFWVFVGITKTYLYNFDPLKPHFYIVKLGFTGVYIIFLISAQNIDCGYSLEPPRRGGSNEYPQSMFWSEIRKKYQNFFLKIFSLLVVKFSVYLNRHVFVMSAHFKRCIFAHLVHLIPVYSLSLVNTVKYEQSIPVVIFTLREL